MLPPAPFLLSLRSSLAGGSRGDSGKGESWEPGERRLEKAGRSGLKVVGWEKFFYNSIVQVVVVFVIIVVVLLPPASSSGFLSLFLEESSGQNVVSPPPCSSSSVDFRRWSGVESSNFF